MDTHKSALCLCHAQNQTDTSSPNVRAEFRCACGRRHAGQRLAALPDNVDSRALLVDNWLSWMVRVTTAYCRLRASDIDRVQGTDHLVQGLRYTAVSGTGGSAELVCAYGLYQQQSVCGRCEDQVALDLGRLRTRLITNLLIYLLIYFITYWFTSLLIYSLTYLFTFLLTDLLPYLFTLLLTDLLPYLFTYLPIYLLTDLLTYLLTDLLTYLLTDLLTYLLIYLLTYLFTYLLIYFITYFFPSLLIYLLTDLLTYWFTYLLTDLLTYLLTYLLTVRSEANRFSAGQETPAFYETSRFIAAFTKASHLSLSWTSSMQSMLTHPTSWRSLLIFRFLWPCIINVGEERTNGWHK